MGLQDNQSSVTYLRLREHNYQDGGKEKVKYGFATSKEGTPYSELEGVITSLSFKNEEYEGTPIRKLIIIVTDPTEGIKYHIGLSVESTSYYNFINFGKNLDLSKPVVLHPRLDTYVKDGKTGTRRSLLMSQDGVFAKSYFTREDPKGLPPWKPVVVNGKTVQDKTDYLAFLEKFVETDLIKQVSDIEVAPKENNIPDTPTNDAPSSNQDAKLPWE